jgi:hypothetical protein
MSMAELANAELRRTNRRLPGRAGADDLQRGPTLEAASQPETPAPAAPPSNALDGLVKYIPTESITLYVAATSALLSVKPVLPPGTAPASGMETALVTPNGLYIGFAILTPILFMLIYMGKRRSQKLSILPEKKTEWPWWKLFASTVAFLVWALAVPPLLESQAGKVAAAFGALLVSTLLNLIGGVVEPADASDPSAGG